jgi:hypothetical protein
MDLLNCNFTSLDKKDFILLKGDAILKVENLRNRIKNSGMLLQNVFCVYVYEFANDQFSYPKGDSSILYIGQTATMAKEIQSRFVHINSDKTETDGNDGQSNITLSNFYHNNKEIKLTIFRVKNKKTMDKLEKSLHQSFVALYSSLPIATGTTSGDYTPKSLKPFIPPCTIKCDC